MVAHITTVAFNGIEVLEVDIQVQISGGMPTFTVVGLPDKAVAESRERVRAALNALGLSLPPKRITVNLSPANLVKEGSHFDLPIALGLLAAMVVAVYVGGVPTAPIDDGPVRLHNLPPPSRIHADAGSFADDILSRLDSVLFEIGISPSWIEPRRPVGGGSDTIDVRVPSDLPVPSVNRQLTQFILWHGGHIVRGQERQGHGSTRPEPSPHQQ